MTWDVLILGNRSSMSSVLNVNESLNKGICLFSYFIISILKERNGLMDGNKERWASPPVKMSFYPETLRANIYLYIYIQMICRCSWDRTGRYHNQNDDRRKERKALRKPAFWWCLLLLDERFFFRLLDDRFCNSRRT